MISLMENQIVDAILKHPCISAKTNKKIRIKINTLKKYLRKHYNIKVEQQEIIQVIEKYLSEEIA